MRSAPPKRQQVPIRTTIGKNPKASQNDSHDGSAPGSSALIIFGSLRQQTGYLHSWRYGQANSYVSTDIAEFARKRLPRGIKAYAAAVLRSRAGEVLRSPTCR